LLPWRGSRGMCGRFPWSRCLRGKEEVSGRLLLVCEVEVSISYLYVYLQVSDPLPGQSERPLSGLLAPSLWPNSMTTKSPFLRSFPISSKRPSRVKLRAERPANALLTTGIFIE
jgi:hypothetical protein